MNDHAVIVVIPRKDLVATVREMLGFGPARARASVPPDNEIHIATTNDLHGGYRPLCGGIGSPDTLYADARDETTCSACRAIDAAAPTGSAPAGSAPTGSASPPRTPTPLDKVPSGPGGLSGDPVQDELDGYQRFATLVIAWVRNFPKDDSDEARIACSALAQPDRPQEMMSAFSGFGSGKVYKYIRGQGGLVAACHDVLLRENLCAEDAEAAAEAAKKGTTAALLFAKRIAFNMVQTGSAISVPVDPCMEAHIYMAPTVEERDRMPLGGPRMEDLDDPTRALRPRP